MRKLRGMQAVVVAVACLGMATVVRASSIPAGTYDLTNVTVDGFELTGSVTLNTGGLVSAADITLNDSAVGNPVFNQIVTTGGLTGDAPASDYAYISAPGEGQLLLEYLTTTDVSGNVDLCVVSAKDCNSYQVSSVQLYNQPNFGYNAIDLNTGTMDAAANTSAPVSAATPEPASLALLGTGILGMAMLTRKRKLRR